MTITHHLLSATLFGAALFGRHTEALGTVADTPHTEGRHTASTHRDTGHRVLLVYYDPSIGADPLLEAIRKDNAEVLYSYHFINALAINLNAKTKTEKAIKRFSKVKGVINVLIDKTVQCDTTSPSPNGPQDARH